MLLNLASLVSLVPDRERRVGWEHQPAIARRGSAFKNCGRATTGVQNAIVEAWRVTDGHNIDAKRMRGLAQRRLTQNQHSKGQRTLAFEIERRHTWPARRCPLSLLRVRVRGRVNLLRLGCGARG